MISLASVVFSNINWLSVKILWQTPTLNGQRLCSSAKLALYIDLMTQIGHHKGKDNELDFLPSGYFAPSMIAKAAAGEHGRSGTEPPR